MNRVFSLALITSLLMGCGGGGGGSGSSSSSSTSGASSGSSGSSAVSAVSSDDSGAVSNGVTTIGRKKILEDISLNEKFSQMAPNLFYAVNDQGFSLKHDTGFFAQKARVSSFDGDARLDLSQIFKFSIFGVSFESEFLYSNIQVKKTLEKMNINLFQAKMMVHQSLAFKGALIDLRSGVFHDNSILIGKRYGALLGASIADVEKSFGVSCSVVSVRDKVYQDVKFEFSINF